MQMLWIAITSTPENYDKFVNFVRRSSHVAAGYKLCMWPQEMYEDFLRRFTEDPFREDTVKPGYALLDEISESQRRK